LVQRCKPSDVRHSPAKPAVGLPLQPIEIRSPLASVAELVGRPAQEVFAPLRRNILAQRRPVEGQMPEPPARSALPRERVRSLARPGRAVCHPQRPLQFESGPLLFRCGTQIQLDWASSCAAQTRGLHKCLSRPSTSAVHAYLPMQRLRALAPAMLTALTPSPRRHPRAISFASGASSPTASSWGL
jgi:hypothetical protein